MLALGELSELQDDILTQPGIEEDFATVNGLHDALNL
jgi:hypothetical protein